MLFAEMKRYRCYDDSGSSRGNQHNQQEDLAADLLLPFFDRLFPFHLFTASLCFILFSFFVFLNLAFNRDIVRHELYLVSAYGADQFIIRKLRATVCASPH